MCAAFEGEQRTAGVPLYRSGWGRAAGHVIEWFK
jgi:hypothetical protein